MKDYFAYLDALRDDIVYSWVIDWSGPVWFNVPRPYHLRSMFGLSSEEAVRVFKAWRASYSDELSPDKRLALIEDWPAPA